MHSLSLLSRSRCALLPLLFRSYELTRRTPTSIVEYAALHGVAASCPKTPTSSQTALWAAPTIAGVVGDSSVWNQLVKSEPLWVVLVGGAATVLAALYRSPFFWNFVSRARRDLSVKILPLQPSHAFQERRTEVERITSSFSALKKHNKGDVVNVTYLTGRPGSGKTQLARQFGREHFARNQRPFFRRQFVGTLNSDSLSSLLESYRSIAMELGCTTELQTMGQLSSTSKGEAQALEVLAAAVRKELKQRPGWLMIVDNLQAESEIPVESTGSGMPDYEVKRLSHRTRVGVAMRSYWPQPGNERWGRGSVLVTTHDRRLVELSSPYVKEVYLEKGMSQSDVMGLLEKVSGMHSDGMNQVVEALEFMPLSVASAGFYIHCMKSRNPSYSFLDYLQDLDRGVQSVSEEMLRHQNISFPITMKTAVSLAAKELATADPVLWKVFLLFACCSRQPVPVSVIARVLSVKGGFISLEMETVRKCSLLVHRSASHVRGVSERDILYDIHASEDDVEVMSVHPGQKEAFEEMFLFSLEGSDVDQGKLEDRNQLLQLFADCLKKEYEEAHESADVSIFALKRMLLPHIENLLQLNDDLKHFALSPDDRAGLVWCLANALMLTGRPRLAIDQLNRALSLLDSIPDTLETRARLMSLLATAVRNSGDVRKAKELALEALAMQESILGHDHPDLAVTLSNIGSSYNRLGEYTSGLKVLSRALSIYEHHFGSSDARVADVLSTVAITHRYLGNILKSEEMLERALRIKEETYGHYHPSVAVTLTSLSTVLRDLGQPKASIDRLERALDINERVYGPSHTSVAITLSNLSTSYRHAGNPEKSREFAEKALAITEKIHGPLHPNVAITLSNLGHTYRDLGSPAKGLAMLERALEINETVYGRKHPGVAITLSMLGSTYRTMGDLASAKEALERALAMKMDVYGPSHPNSAVTMRSLGKVYRLLGKMQQSKELLERSMEIKKSQHGEEHREVAINMANIANVYRDMNQLQKARDLAENALAIYERSSKSGLGEEDHPDLADFLTVVGGVLKDSGDLKGARRHLERAMSIREVAHGLEHYRLAATLSELASTYHELGQSPKKTQRLFERALQIATSAYGQEHPLVATINVQYSEVLKVTHDFKRELQLLQDAGRIREKVFGEIHSAVAQVLLLLGRSQLEQAKFSDSQNSLEKALRIYQELHDRSERAGEERHVVDHWMKCRIEVGNCLVTVSTFRHRLAEADGYKKEVAELEEKRTKTVSQ